jgi:hypothetical protein
MFRFIQLASIALALSTISMYAQDIKPENVKRDMKRVADWQIEHYRDSYTNKEPHHPLDWTNGALYVGMIKWAAMAVDDSYYEWLRSIGAGSGSAWPDKIEVYGTGAFLSAGSEVYKLYKK